MKRVQVFIEHDIIIRHFILNNTFREVTKNYQVQFVFPEDDVRVATKIESLGLGDVVKVPVNRKRLGAIRELSKIQTIQIARKKKDNKWIKKQWRAFFGLKTYCYMWVKSLPFIFNWYSKKTLKQAGDFPELEKVVTDFDPDIIVHPTVLEGLFITDLISIASKKQIPFLALMNSWDNPSTKAMVIKPPDYLVVWGEQTKNHSVDFLGIDPDRVRIMGSAQMEVYRQKPAKSREELCEILEINPDKKLILYAGSSKSINEMNHLLLLEKAIEDGLLPDCYIIFRPHPWRNPGREEVDFFDVQWKHISMDPGMTDFYISPKQKGEKKINLTDYMDTHNMLCAVDLLISNVSTILLEAAIHGKPVLCMVADEDIKVSDFLRVTMVSLYFQELLEKMEIPRCKDYEDLPGHCMALLEKASAAGFSSKQKENARYFADQTGEPYPVQVKQYIEEIINQWKSQGGKDV